MSEDKKPTALGEMITKMTSGIDKIKTGKKPAKSEPEHEEEIVIGEPVAEHEPEYAAAGNRKEKLEPGFESDEDLIAGEFEKTPPARPSLKSSMSKMTLKQKAVAAAIVVVAVFALKNHFSGAPSTMEEMADNTDSPAYVEMDLELPSTTLSEGPDKQAEQSLPGFEMDDDPMFAGMSVPESEEVAVPETDAPFPSFDADMPLPPSAAETPSDSPFAAAPPPTPSENFASALSGPANTDYENTSSFDTPFGGSGESNPDSGKSDLEPGSDTQLAAAQEALEKNNARVAELEKKLKEANAKLKQEQSAVHRTAVAAAPKPRAPAPRPTVAKQSPVVSAPAPRPSLCVAAVAQAARNCTTCVAHAFLTHKGQETMLGHGDFIEGYRVSIIGDRLDLQTTNGEVVHKYWSSPDGCS